MLRKEKSSKSGNRALVFRGRSAVLTSGVFDDNLAGSAALGEAPWATGLKETQTFVEKYYPSTLTTDFHSRTDCFWSAVE